MRKTMKIIGLCMMGLCLLGGVPSEHLHAGATAKYRIAKACGDIRTEADLHVHAGAACSTLLVTFYKVEPASSAAGEACRAYLDKASKAYPLKDISALAFFHPKVQGAVEQETPIYPFGGNARLHYSASSGSIEVQD